MQSFKFPVFLDILIFCMCVWISFQMKSIKSDWFWFSSTCRSSLSFCHSLSPFSLPGSLPSLSHPSLHFWGFVLKASHLLIRVSQSLVMWFYPRCSWICSSVLFSCHWVVVPGSWSDSDGFFGRYILQEVVCIFIRSRMFDLSPFLC